MKDLIIIRKISIILEGIDNLMENIEKLQVNDLNYNKFVPITFIVIEHLFSRSKNWLLNSSRLFTFKNIWNILVTQFNYSFEYGFTNNLNYYKLQLLYISIQHQLPPNFKGDCIIFQFNLKKLCVKS